MAGGRTLGGARPFWVIPLGFVAEGGATAGVTVTTASARGEWVVAAVLTDDSQALAGVGGRFVAVSAGVPENHLRINDRPAAIPFDRRPQISGGSTASGAGAEFDSDGDFSPDLEEQAAGTNPGDKSSAPVVLSSLIISRHSTRLRPNPPGGRGSTALSINNGWEVDSQFRYLMRAWVVPPGYVNLLGGDLFEKSDARFSGDTREHGGDFADLWNHHAAPLASRGLPSAELGGLAPVALFIGREGRASADGPFWHEEIFTRGMRYRLRGPARLESQERSYIRARWVKEWPSVEAYYRDLMEIGAIWAYFDKTPSGAPTSTSIVKLEIPPSQWVGGGAHYSNSHDVVPELRSIPEKTKGVVLVTERLLPVEIETNYVDRDDPVKTWTTTGASKVLPKGQAVYAGKETGDLVSWTLPTNITTLFGGGTYTWTAERKTPASPAVTVTGVTGVDKTEWKLTSPLDWKPGTYKIRCSIAKNGATTPLEFEQRVGVRTDDVVVVGWIDPAPIVLTTAGVQAPLLSVLPVGGFSLSDGDNAKLKAGLLIKHISEVGVGSAFQVDEPWYAPPIIDGVDFAAFSAADKTYALRWMFKHGSNPAPDPDFSVSASSLTGITGLTTIMSQTELDAFAVKTDKTHYKLLNHYQVKFLTAPDGKFDPGSVTIPTNKKQAEIGNTKDPARLYDVGGIFDSPGLWIQQALGNYPAGGVFPGTAGANNWALAGTPTETKLCNEGKPDAKAMAAFGNLAGGAVSFDIWSSITFYSDLTFYSEKISPSTGASLTRAPKPSQFHQGRINTQIYPTYWIYINGVKSPFVQSQHPDPAVLLFNTDKCQ
jgi:hypothetical protein